MPYEKGYLMLRALEESLGGDAFARFVRDWFARFAGQSVTSEQFHEFAAAHAPGFDFENWLNQSGVPKGAASDGAPGEAATGAELPPDWSNQLQGGRIKRLRPIYLALCRDPARRAEAARLYRQHRDGYHPIARRQLERLFREQGVAVEEVKPLGLGPPPHLTNRVR